MNRVVDGTRSPGVPEEAPAARQQIRRDEIPDQEMPQGAVTFLDVLGWKGIWLRRAPNEVVRLLEGLVDLAKRTAWEQRGRTVAGEVEVLSVSDTIVLLTYGKAEQVLPVHGLICEKIICDSIRNGIPIRGATSYGGFAVSDGSTILIGPAIDEAAAWHEALDWIGLIMTPSAQYSWRPTAPWAMYNDAPIKGWGAKPLWCLDWPRSWNEDDEIQRIFAEAGPLDPSIAGKYMNTLAFFHKRSP